MARRAEFAVLAATLACAPVPPALAAERPLISIAQGRLGDAVIALGRQTGTSIGMSDQSLAGLPVPAVGGRMSVGAALDRMLRRTGARAERIDATSWRIVRTASPSRPAPPPPRADPAPLPDLPQPDIIVTASKRDIPLSRYAGMVELVEGAALTGGEAAAGTAALLGRVASLSSTHVGSGRNKLFIRAIADSGFSGPTQATTGQYLGDMRLNYAAPDPDLRLYDVGGVEVLEGPQGTLYGAGSLGGILRVVPNAPNLGIASGQVSAGLTAVQHGDMGGDIAGVVNLPIVAEKLTLRAVAYGVREGGYIDDRRRSRRDVNDTRIGGGRAALRFAPDADWTIDVSTLYQRTDGDDAQYASRDVGRLARASSVAQPYSADYILANLRVERQWDDLRLVSSSGYVRHAIAESYDATQPGDVPALFRQRNRIDIISIENRLIRDLDNGLGWIIGAAYLESRSDIRRSLTYYGDAPGFASTFPGIAFTGPGIPATATGVRNRVTEATLFGEASFEPAKGLIATLGGRLTHNRLSGRAMDPTMLLSSADLARAQAQADARETIFLPSIALLSDAIPGLTFYARYQQGFRPGGLAVDDQHVQRFRNDRIATLEIGLRRGRPGIDSLAFSANVGWTDWRDIQADLTDRLGLPTTANIGDGRIYTIEARVVGRPLPALTLDGSIIYNDSRLSQPASFLRTLKYGGQSLALPNVAAWGGRAAFDYRLAWGDTVQLRLSGSARYVGKSRLGIGPVLGNVQGDYVDTSLSAAWRRGPVELSLTLTNLFDSTGNRFALGTPFDLKAGFYTPLRPRTLRLGMDFAF
ncbi:TonB-dependent receptor [Sphingobium sp. AN641]|uniref:TonB-dependent receptor domain-containing protein n=1 Tax=Sphingobium sp. AN641 TaxID=3133443 RepID=UPI0030C47138